MRLAPLKLQRPARLASASSARLPRAGLGLRLTLSELELGRRTLLTHSSVIGPTHPLLDTRTLSTFFAEELLVRVPDRPALICRSERAGPGAFGGPSSSSSSLASANSRVQTSNQNLGRTDCLAWSFAELHAHSEALAAGLRAMGVRTGDRVGVVMGNTSAYAALQWAVARAGAILVTINPAYRIHELITTLNLASIHTLILARSIRTSHYLSLLLSSIPSLRTCSPGAIEVEALPALRNVLVFSGNPSESGTATEATDEGFREELADARCAVDLREAFMWSPGLAERHDLEQVRANASADDVVNLQFTSGTTGYPKAVSLTHTNLLNNALSIGRCMDLREDDVLFLLLLPLVLALAPVTNFSHPTLIRLVLGNLAAWSQRSCIVYPSPIFSPPDIVSALVDEKCSALHGVPTHFLGVLGEIARRRSQGEELRFERLRTGIAAGAPVPIELMRRLIDEMGLVGLTNAYGMTETSPVSFQTSPTDPLDKRTETVGRVQPHVRAKLLDPEDGKTVVPVGTPGEICVAGYLLQKGYWQDDAQTRAVMRTHADIDPDDPDTVWMHTGDIGIMDAEGYLRVVGRSKDIIIRGGENLFPVQIENRLTFHPRVREAAVVAVPDTTYGEVVGAFVVREGEDLPSPSDSNSNSKSVSVSASVSEAINVAKAELGPELTPEEAREVAQAEEEVLTPEVLRAWVAQGMNPQNAPAWVWLIPGDTSYSKPPSTSAQSPVKPTASTAQAPATTFPSDALAAPLPRTASGKVQKHILRARARVLAEAGIGRVG